MDKFYELAFGPNPTALQITYLNLMLGFLVVMVLAAILAKYTSEAQLRDSQKQNKAIESDQ